MQEEVLQELLSRRTELFGFIRALVRNTHDAEDIFQEVSMAVLKQAERGEAINDFEKWSKQVARNCVLKHFRNKRSRRTRLLPAPEMVDLLDHVYLTNTPGHDDLTNQTDALFFCLKAMPEKSASIVQLRYAEDRSYPEIASRIRSSEQAVRRAVSRARLALMDCVKRRLGMPSPGAMG